jgi:paraquat-inducible protein A
MGQITAKTLAPKNYHACHACDLLVYNTDVSPGEKAICPRCGTVIEAPKRNTLDRTLAMVLSGLVLFIPAVCLPILSMTILGKISFNTLIGGVIGMYNEGFYWVALLVLLFSIVAPLLKLLTLAIVLLQVKFCIHTSYLAGLFRFEGHLDSWAMVEVYMISLLVAVVKLFEIAKINIGVGLFCFIGLLLFSTLAAATLDRKYIWDEIGDLKK